MYVNYSTFYFFHQAHTLIVTSKYVAEGEPKIDALRDFNGCLNRVNNTLRFLILTLAIFDPIPLKHFSINRIN